MLDPDYLPKKQPRQARSKFTVSAIKEAATHILREAGLAEFNTNAVAERAGVSIGSLYQYFPTKEALIAEIKRGHFAHLRSLMKESYEQAKDGTLEQIVDSFIRASIAAHQSDPQLHRVLSGDLAEFKVKEDDNSEDSIRPMIEDVLGTHQQRLRLRLNISQAAKLCYRVVEQVTHDAVLNNPEDLADDEFAVELRIMLLAYLTQEVD